MAAPKGVFGPAANAAFYSQEIRDAVVDAVDIGIPKRQIARHYEIDYKTIYRWYQHETAKRKVACYDRRQGI